LRDRAFEETYIHLPIRATNDTDMLYKCQMASLSENALSTLLLKKDEYYVGDQPSGNLLLRVIIRESLLDNNANTSIIRTKLSKLDQYMPMCKGNIKIFNEYVQLQLHSLNARGETTDDLLLHLFAACKVAMLEILEKLSSNVDLNQYTLWSHSTNNQLQSTQLN
jgi:hypothetical protein